MKVPLSWLRELVAIETPLPELRQRLTMAGLEVEDVHEVGSDWQGVTIGRVVELYPHPRRDALNVARVELNCLLEISSRLFPMSLTSLDVAD